MRSLTSIVSSVGNDVTERAPGGDVVSMVSCPVMETPGFGPIEEKVASSLSYNTDQVEVVESSGSTGSPRLK